MWMISKENLEQILKIESKHLKRRFWVKIFKLIDFRQRIIFWSRQDKYLREYWHKKEDSLIEQRAKINIQDGDKFQ